MKLEWATKEIAIILGVTERAVQKRALREKWPYKAVQEGARTKRVYFFGTLPESIKINITTWHQKQSVFLPASKTHPPSIITASPGNQPALCQAQIDKAMAKADLLQHYRKHIKKSAWGSKAKARKAFIGAYNSGLAYPKLFEILGKVNWKTIEGWSRLASYSGDMFCLVDRRGYWKQGQQSVTDEQANILLRCALHPNRPFISEAIRMARAIMSTRGIEDGHSDRTYRRWIDDWKSKNYHVWVFNRQGAKAWNDECAYYIERDYSLINVGDILVADGHSLNFEILNPWTGKPKRMALILWYDMKSNFPLGWEIMPTEDTRAISSALRRAILRLGKYPKVAYLDNGKAFRARFFRRVDFEQAGFSGLYERLGMKTIFAWPYHGQSKTVERFFKIFEELERWMPTYVGTSIENKPPRLKRGEKLHRKAYDKLTQGMCLTMEQAHMAIASWFDEYVKRPQRGHLEGRTPLELFLEGKGAGVDPVELQYLMMDLKIKTINRNGIRFLGKNYYDPALYGRKHPVTIRYDLQDESSIFVFELNGNFLCEAHQTEKLHPAATHLGTDEDRAKLKAHIEYKRHQEKEASASARAFLETEIIPEHRRQLEIMGIDQEGQKSKAQNNKVKQLPEKLTKADEERILKEFEELKELNKDMPKEEPEEAYIPEVEDETTEIWKMLPTLSEMDRFDKLIELEVRGWVIPKQFRGFMQYYEQTPEYARYKDYFDEHRARVVMMYQLEREAADNN